VRDSVLKRTLVGAYFNAVEVGHAVAGMVRAPAYGRVVDTYDEYWRGRAPGAAWEIMQRVRPIQQARC